MKSPRDSIEMIITEINEAISLINYAEPNHLESAIKFINNFAESGDKELKRMLNRLPDNIVEQLSSCSMVTRYGEKIKPYYKKSYKIMLAHALEYKNLYSPTHYVFTHAQALVMWVYVKFVKILIKHFQPNRNLSLFSFLRFSERLTSNRSPQDYIKLREVDDRDSKFRDEILAADGYLLNLDVGESAGYFCQRNDNILGHPNKFFNKKLREFMENDLNLEPETYKEHLDTVYKYANEFSQLSDTGNLFVICVPKDQVAKCVYESEPASVPCHHNDSESVIPNTNIHAARLQLLQNDNYKKEDAVCSWREKTSSDAKPVAQYRIFPQRLKHENGARVFTLSPVCKIARQDYKRKLNELADEIYVSNHTKFSR